EQIDRAEPTDHPVRRYSAPQDIRCRQGDEDIGNDHPIGITIQKFDERLAYLVFLHRTLARWKAETNRVGGQLGATVQIKLPHEILAMFPGGQRADAETAGDVAVG